MTKLTTERLDKLQDNLLQFQDSYSDPEDKENYGIFVDALHVLDEFKAAKEKLLAYEQAAKNPIGSFHISGGQVEATTDYCRDGEWPVQDGEVLVYAAPVLPKQPELLSIGELLHRLEEQTGEKWVEESAQPVIPEQPDSQDLELYIDMLENSDSDDEDGELNNTQLIMWLKELQRRRTLPAQPVSELYKLNGWISVDEQMPETTRKDQYFITYRRPNKDFKSVTGGFSIDLFRNGCFAFSGVTHWMPLPAAPAQESE